MTNDDAAPSREPSPVAPQVAASLASPVVSSAASPGPGTLAGQVFKSPASWFQRSSTPATTSSTAKHSLLAMVPSRPLSRPSSAAPPSPARNLQPPSIPALDQAKQSPSSDSALVSNLPALPQPAAPQQQLQHRQPQQQQQQQQGPVDTDKQDKANVEQGSPTLTLQTQPEVDQQAASKRARRDKRIQKTAASMHWQLMKRLAEISTDVEMLNHEVARIKHEQSTALVAEDQKDLSEQEEQQLEALHQKRFQDLITRQCATVLKSVQAHKWAFPFARPVDVSIFKDYPVIITQPMDFASIKAKVEGGKYKQPQQFHDDMKLVFANARRYNPPGSDVNLMANGIEEKFDERWQALLLPKLAEEDMHARTDEAAVRKQRLEKAQVRQAGELEQQRLRLGSAFEGLHSAILDAESLAAAACKPVSHRHKEALIPALESLTAEQFEWAMSLVHARYPGLPSGPGEEMQFDITCLDSLALRQLMDLTQACAKAAQSAEDAQVIWPANPVGVGSKGHKPGPNKRPRRSPTPPPEIVPAHPPAQSAPVAPTPLAHMQSAPTVSVPQQSHVTPAMPQQTGPGLQQPAQFVGQKHRTHSPQPAAQQPRTDSPQLAAQQPYSGLQQPIAQLLLQPAGSAQQPASEPVVGHHARQVHPQAQPPTANQSPLVSSNRNQFAPQLPHVAQTGSAFVQPSSTTQQATASQKMLDATPAQAVRPNLAQALPSPAVQTAPRPVPSLSQQIGLAHLAALNSAGQSPVLLQNAPAAFPPSLAAAAAVTSSAAAAVASSAAAPLAISSAAPPDPAAGDAATPDLKAQATFRQAPLAAASSPSREAWPAQQASSSPQLHHDVAQVQQTADDAGEPPSKRLKLAQEPSVTHATGRDSEKHLPHQHGHVTVSQLHAQSHMAPKQQPQQHKPEHSQGMTQGSASTLQPASQQAASNQPGPGETSVLGASNISQQIACTSLDQQQQQLQSKSPSSEPVVSQPSIAAGSEPSGRQQVASPHAAEPSQPVEQASSETKASSEPQASSTPSQDSDEEYSEEEEAGESQSRAGSKSQAKKGRKAQAADAKQETRQSQRKPTPSRKGSAAAAAAAAGRVGSAGGRRGSRGRASTPSARAAPKPQRTTSRKTAGKRRRSPS